MNETKIQFSKFETELMCNTDIILTKNRILEKVRLLFEELQKHMAGFEPHRPNQNEIFKIPAKISKGENYKGLPYLILDYPRFFKSENIFAVRTMFWWGNFFSSTLHISGLQKFIHGPALKANSALLAQKHFYIGVNSNPWIHHFEETNYRKIEIGKDIPEEDFTLPHLKIATKMPLEEWPSALETLLKNWRLLISVSEGLVATNPVE